jgi:hypothetical protein
MYCKLLHAIVVLGHAGVGWHWPYNAVDLAHMPFFINMRQLTHPRWFLSHSVSQYLVLATADG